VREVKIQNSKFKALLLATIVVLTGCGGSPSAAPAETPTPRPILISSTDTPGPPRVDASGPAVPNSTVSTPFATSTPLPAASGAPATTPTPVTLLRVQDFSFAPPTVTTTVGTKLTWTNAGPSNHTVTANDGSFDSGPIQLNGSFSFTPTKPGTYAYRCTIHPTMSGTLVVRAPSAG
jgi:plastocyanin